MSDDSHKHGLSDRGPVSWQHHELSYVKAKAIILCPRATIAEIEDAIGHCKASVAPIEGREKMIACVQRRLAPRPL